MRKATLCLFTCTLILFSAQHSVSEENYKYSADMFSGYIKNWEKQLKRYKGKPNLSYLEVGAHEGRSFFWVLDNILTHPTSKAVALDLFDMNEAYPHFHKNFEKNLKTYPGKAEIKVVKGYSQEKLKNFANNSFDIIYIDADHRLKGIMSDLVLSWPLLKTGGVLIVDDYNWRPKYPIDLRPQKGVDLFISGWREELEIIYKEYQVFIRKKEYRSHSLAFLCHLCTKVGPYRYDWLDQEVFRIKDHKRAKVTDKDRLLIEKELGKLKLGQTKVRDQKKVLRVLEKYEHLLNKK